MIQAEFENRNGNDKLNNRAVNGPQEELVAQYTSKKNDKPISSGKITTTNSANPFASDLMTHQPLNLCEDVSEKRKEEELQFQKRLLSIVEVVGLPIRKRDQKSLQDLFKVLCDSIMSVDPKEIENIRSDGEILTVSFHDKLKVDKLLQRSRQIKDLKSDDIIKLLPGEIAKPVKFFRKKTNFYRQICYLANDYALNKQLYSFQVCSEGLGIKFTASGENAYVRSRAELNQIIGQNELKKKSSGAPPVPPRRNQSN